MRSPEPWLAIIAGTLLAAGCWLLAAGCGRGEVRRYLRGGRVSDQGGGDEDEVGGENCD
jgi:hypothetical protein